MNFLKKIIDSLFKIDFWQIFISNSSMDEFMNTKGKAISYNCFLIKNNFKSFFADPFFIDVKKDKFTLFVEDFSFLSGAKITLLKYENKKQKTKKILYGKHYSYPFNTKEKRKIYLFPEMTEQKRNTYYILNNLKIEKQNNYLLGYKIIDPTIFKHKGLYWLICSLSGKNLDENTNLYLFYSSDLKGDWISHVKNPIYKNNSNARGAGSVFEHKGKIFRPSQSYKNKNYGSAIVINELKTINTREFKEKKIFKVNPFYNFEGIHHISYMNKFFAYDQKKTVYSILKPFYYIIKLLK